MPPDVTAARPVGLAGGLSYVGLCVLVAWWFHRQIHGESDEVPPSDDDSADTSDDLSGPMVVLLKMSFAYAAAAMLLMGVGTTVGIPRSAFGLSAKSAPGVVGDVRTGVLVGTLLWIAGELVDGALAVVAPADASGSTMPRPDGPVAWAMLFGFVIPVAAAGKVVLFVGVYLGGVSWALGLSPWLAVLPASLVEPAIAGGGWHRVNLFVQWLVLGATLAATSSLLAVGVAAVAHRVLALVVHSGLGVDPSDRLATAIR